MLTQKTQHEIRNTHYRAVIEIQKSSIQSGDPIMKNTFTLITPTCTCCPQPSTLVPRDDLADGLAACSQTGQLYRPEGNGYVTTTMPALRNPNRTVESVQIDLSRSGYA
jgi:hypothetical protein